MHHKAIVLINEVPTVVETWGRWIEETPKDKKETIVLCIPGNPGVTGYYKQFLETIHNKLQCSVWIVSHAGHQRINNAQNFQFPKLSQNERLYDLQGQIAHKEEFFKKYVPSDARVFIIGHSIGSYVTLKLLKNPAVNAKVVKSYLLFPTIEDMAATKNGQFLTKFVYYILFIILFLAKIFTLLPKLMQNLLLYIYFKINCLTTEELIPPTRELIHPATLNKIFFMAFDEMEKVSNLSSDLIEPFINKIKLYYGATDNWAPPDYYRRIIEKYPKLNAELCTRDFNHAFIFRSSTNVGNMVAGWIELDK